jgi:DUF971 family protein
MKTYTIKQGNHYANGLNFKLHSNLHQLNFKAKLSSNCLYQFDDADNFDINKLYGVTWGLTNDNNSFRIGWNCQNNNGMIQYFAYMHKNGSMSWQYLFQELPNVEINFHIEFLKDVNYINIYRLDAMESYGIWYQFSDVSNTGYYNFPYFGGNKVAPHDMTIGIE